jgi:RNA polymerase sigma-70 factor (ECF subfamily)
MIYWGGLSRREVAEKLGVPLGTVHTRLRLGMDKLRDTFSRLFSGE